MTSGPHAATATNRLVPDPGASRWQFEVSAYGTLSLGGALGAYASLVDLSDKDALRESERLSACWGYRSPSKLPANYRRGAIPHVVGYAKQRDRHRSRSDRGGRTLMRRFLSIAFVVSAGACNERKATDAAPVDVGAEAVKLGAFLPSRLGAFAAAGPASTTGELTGPSIEAERSYVNADGRKVTVRLATGDLSRDLASLDSDETHAFGSDTLTYWRTTAIAGHRARIAEERPAPKHSECLVRVGPNHIADVRIAPTSTPGDCTTVASLLDFGAIVASGGVPGPLPSRKR